MTGDGALGGDPSLRLDPRCGYPEGKLAPQDERGYEIRQGVGAAKWWFAALDFNAADFTFAMLIEGA